MTDKETVKKIRETVRILKNSPTSVLEYIAQTDVFWLLGVLEGILQEQK